MRIVARVVLFILIFMLVGAWTHGNLGTNKFLLDNVSGDLLDNVSGKLTYP